ncbi:Protein ALP1-like, partial [Pseudolycoriella hygida]
MESDVETDAEDTDLEESDDDDVRSAYVDVNDLDILHSFIHVIELNYIINSTEESRHLKRRKRRWGVHPINQMRKELGHFENLVNEMLIHDHDKFFNFTRMSPNIFDVLLDLISPKITKFAPNAIPSKFRLLLTLRFLATGDCLKSLHYNFCLGVSTAYNIVNETCAAIWNVLSPLYLKYPTQQDWLRIASEFYEKLKFPNCCGAVDVKLIEIRAPKKSGSKFFNYKRFFSTNLLAICDAEKNFIYVDIGSYGCQSDGGVFFHSTFGRRLDMHSLDLPPPAPLPNTITEFPFFIIGDTAYPMHEHILTPYPGKCTDLSEIQRNFNKELNSVRQNIENTFAILSQRWQVFCGPIDANPDMVDHIVMAAVVLHNYIKSFNDPAAVKYMRGDKETSATSRGLRAYEFVDGWIELNRGIGATRNAHCCRDKYANYLY